MKNKLVLVILIFISVSILAAGVTIFLASYSKNPIETSIDNSIDVLSKVKLVEITGGTIALSENDLNNVLSLYFKNGRRRGDLIIEGANIKLSNEAISVFIQSKYKTFKFLLCANGLLSYNNNYIVFTPKSFKIGNLPIPKVILFKALLNYSNSDIIIRDNNILISRVLIPFTISDLSIKDNKILLNIDKFIPESSLFMETEGVANKTIDKQQAVNLLENISQKLEVISNNVSLNTENKSKLDNIKNQINLINVSESEEVMQNNIEQLKIQLVDVAKDSNDSSQIESVSQIVNEVKNIQVIKPPQPAQNTESSKQQALIKISGQLSSVINSLSDSKEQQVVAMIQGSINSTISNPSHNYKGDVAAVRSVYSKLSQSQKNNIKAAIISNVDAGTANQLRIAYGL